MTVGLIPCASGHPETVPAAEHPRPIASTVSQRARPLRSLESLHGERRLARAADRRQIVSYWYRRSRVRLLSGVPVEPSGGIRLSWLVSGDTAVTTFMARCVRSRAAANGFQNFVEEIRVGIRVLR